MPFNYTGVASNVSLASAAQARLVTDGDPDNAASINDGGIQKIIDYLEALRQATAYAIFNFIGNPGNAATTTYMAWASASQGAPATNPTTGANGQTRLMVPFPAVLRRFAVRTGATLTGGPATVTLVNFSTGIVMATISLSAGNGGALYGTFTPGTLTVSAGDIIEAQIANGAGVSASIGLSTIAASFALG